MHFPSLKGAGPAIHTYLVTGGAGFIGSHIVDELLIRGHRVRVLDSFFSGRMENLDSAMAVSAAAPGGDDWESALLQVVEGDLRDRETCVQACEDIDRIIHLGAVPSVPRSIADPFTTNDVNVRGTLDLLVAARDAGVQRLVYISSSSVYGDEPGIPKVETMATLPMAPYAVSKLAGEHYTRSAWRVWGLETVSVRYFNVFGPRQNPASEYAAVIPKFITMMLAGEAPTIFGDGENSRDFTFIRNVVEGTLLAAEVQGVAGETFNIACGGRFTLNELVDELNVIMGTSLESTYDSLRKGDVPHSQAGIDKARGLLGFEPSVDFQEGLRRTVEWYRAQVAADESSTAPLPLSTS